MDRAFDRHPVRRCFFHASRSHAYFLQGKRVHQRNVRKPAGQRRDASFAERYLWHERKVCERGGIRKAKLGHTPEDTCDWQDFGSPEHTVFPDHTSGHCQLDLLI